MATIRTGLQLYDQMSGVLGGVISSINMTVAAMDDLQGAMHQTFDRSSIDAARSAIQQTEAALRALPPPIIDAENEQRKLNQALVDGEEVAGGLLRRIIQIGTAIGAALSVQKTIELSDQMVSLTARLDLMNDGLQTTEELQRKIFAAAQRSRGAYMPMADSIAILGSQARDAFASNDELIFFMEQINKTFAIAGTSAAGAESVMYNLTQALASGVLRGQDLNSVMSNAQPIVQNIADYLGVSVGEIRDMAAEGMLTADVVKAAMFAAADETNAKFEAMPRTWGDVWTAMKNDAVAMFSPVLQRLNDLANSERFVQMSASITRGLGSVAAAADWLLNLFISIASFVSDNWTVIEPIIWGITGALTAYLLITQGVAAWTKIAGAAQKFWNEAVMKHPILFLVGAVVALILWLVKLWKTNDQVAAGMYRAWNAVLNFFDQVPIFFMWVGIGVINAFQSMKVKSLQIVEALVNGVISSINWLIDKLNKIPGVSLKAIEQVDFTTRAAAEAEAIRQAGEEALANARVWAAERALAREQRVLDFLENRAAKRALEDAEQAAVNDWSFDIDSIGTVDEVGRIRDTVDISAEDLRIMRELAEMKSIQNFVTLAPTVSFGDTHIRQDGRSVDEIIGIIAERLDTEIESSARAVFG